MVDLHNDHNVHFYDANSGSIVHKDKGGTNKVMDICFSGKAGD